MKSSARARLPGLLSILLLGVGVWLPSEGVGFTICLFYRSTQLPCPGCGLTRSVASTLEADLPLALSYNVGGPVATLLFVTLAVTAVLPTPQLQRVRAWGSERFERHRRWFDLAFYSWLAYGCIRFFAAWAGVWPWWH